MFGYPKMKAVLQRVASASVDINDKTIGSIDKGLLVLLGVEKDDSISDLDYLVKKTINLRIFNDNLNNMNLSVQDISGGVLVVSQFTLCANTRRGRRPSFIDAAHPKIAESLYLEFCDRLKKKNISTQTGKFGGMMKINLINDGPVTFILDSQNK